MLWARPEDGELHAIEPRDVAFARERGYAQTLCGTQLPAEGLAFEAAPSGSLCMPCVIDATADMPDPGQFGLMC